MRMVIFKGKEHPLSQLCRELRIDRRTVVSRIERGMSIHDALMRPPRRYPSETRRTQSKPESSSKPDSPLLIQDAIDLMIDLREILASLESTPRRERILSGVRRWLRRAGWR
tara:strand:+ start:567 stop:902 length:336 start_codon:yes stop_codon:yes gene_type:complete